MSKKQSLSSRADMHPIGPYSEQITDIPKSILSKKGSLTMFGSSCHLRLLEMRRKQNNIEHSTTNTLAIENDNYFINASKDDTTAEAEYRVVSYQDHIKIGLDKDVKFAIRNTPYNYPGQGAARLWEDVIRADNKIQILDYQSDILPTSLLRSSDLKDIRDTFFNVYGLYKVRPFPFSTFLEYGAKVPTAGYFCTKGFTDDITVKTDISEYQYDFRSKGIIVTPDTKDEVDFLFNCLDKTGYTWNKHNFKESFVNTKSMKIKDGTIFSFTKNNTFKYPIVIKLNKNGTYQLGYTSIIVDPNSINFDKIVTPYQCSSYASGGSDLGNVIFVPAGTQIMSGYVWTPINENDKDAHIKYLQSTFVKYLLAEWRTSQTNDGPQLKIIPELLDTSIQTDDDILELFGAKDLKDEIINGLGRKTKKK